VITGDVDTHKTTTPRTNGLSDHAASKYTLVPMSAHRTDLTDLTRLARARRRPPRADDVNAAVASLTAEYGQGCCADKI
jgi:hypothetical protein